MSVPLQWLLISNEVAYHTIRQNQHCEPLEKTTAEQALRAAKQSGQRGEAGARLCLSCFHLSLHLRFVKFVSLLCLPSACLYLSLTSSVSSHTFQLAKKMCSQTLKMPCDEIFNSSLKGGGAVMLLLCVHSTTRLLKVDGKEKETEGKCLAWPLVLHRSYTGFMEKKKLQRSNVAAAHPVIKWPRRALKFFKNLYFVKLLNCLRKI